MDREAVLAGSIATQWIFYKDRMHYSLGTMFNQIGMGVDPKVMTELTVKLRYFPKGSGGPMHIFPKNTVFYGWPWHVVVQIPFGAGSGLLQINISEEMRNLCYNG